MDTDAESLDTMVAVSPSPTGPPRALASATLMLTLSATDMLQSSPRDTQAGPELLPQDSSPPATDADWARGPLMPSPPSVTATGPHRELTVWDITAADTTGVKQYVKYNQFASRPSIVFPPR